MHEQHHTAHQPAKMWRLSDDTIRDLFKGEEGVLRITKHTCELNVAWPQRRSAKFATICSVIFLSVSVMCKPGAKRRLECHGPQSCPVLGKPTLLDRIDQISTYGAQGSPRCGFLTCARREAQINYSSQNGHKHPLRCRRNGHCHFVLVLSQ